MWKARNPGNRVEPWMSTNIDAALERKEETRANYPSRQEWLLTQRQTSETLAGMQKALEATAQSSWV